MKDSFEFQVANDESGEIYTAIPLLPAKHTYEIRSSMDMYLTRYDKRVVRKFLKDGDWVVVK
jgi:hypothetical protein